MPRNTSTRSAGRKPAQITVSFHPQGFMPEDVKIAKGANVGNFKQLLTEEKAYNFSGYQLVVIRKGAAVEDVNDDTVLEKGDVLRLGVKTKNA